MRSNAPTQAIDSKKSPLGPFRTFQVPIADIAALTRLEMPDLIAADHLPAAVAAAGWRRIEEPAEIQLAG